MNHSPRHLHVAQRDLKLDIAGRRTVVVGFGDRVDDAHYVALSIPDAHDLVRRVRFALEAPLPTI